MKKIAIVLFVLIALFSFAGCQNEITQNDEPTEATDDDIKLLSYYFRSFGHDRVLGDTDTILKKGKVEGLEATGVLDETAGTLTFTVELDGYDFDGHADNDVLGIYQRLASGTMTVTYTGKLNEEKTVFTADKAEFTDVDGTLSVDYSSAYPVDSIDVTCDKASATFTNKEKTEASAVLFDIKDGKAVSISNVGEVSFALVSAENVSVDGHIIADTIPPLDNEDTDTAEDTGADAE